MTALLAKHNHLTSPPFSPFTIPRIVDIAESFRTEALSETLTCQLRAPHSSSLANRFSFLLFYQLGDVLLVVELSDGTSSFVELIDDLLLFFI